MKNIFSLTNLGLLFIWAGYSLFIVYQSVTDSNGFITSDSAHYLQLAQNILNGDGFTTVGYVDGISTYFATWPVGYPVLIAVVSFLTGLNVVWGAKLVNIFCLGFCFIILKQLFQGRAVTVALVFFISTFAALFSYTWSEVPFLLGLLWLVFAVVNYINSEKKRYIIHMFLASLFLFFMRYIGLIGAGIIGLVGFYYLFKKEWKPMLACWITGSLSLVIAGIYLLNNYIQTGLMTGMERIPRKETFDELFTKLKEAMWTEVNFLSIELDDPLMYSLIVVALALVIFIRPRHITGLFSIRKEDFLLPGMFLFVGIVYFIGIVYMRFSAYFDSFNFRLLGPATFMFVLFFVSWIAMVDKRKWHHWQLFLTSIFLIACVNNLVLPTYEAWKSDEPTYQETVQQVREDFDVIPKESIVAFENIHARYLRTDIQFIKVHFKPYFAEPESLEEFTERITPNNAAGVYFQKKSLVGYDYDSSFVKIMEKAEDTDQTFVQLESVLED